MISVAYKEDDKENDYNRNNIIKFERKKHTIRCEEPEEEEEEEEEDGVCVMKNISNKICCKYINNGIRSSYPFHECSNEMYTWISKQNHVKEESLTDWLLYDISQKCNFVFYQAFSRHEESQNGSDWEWWILTEDSSGVNKFNAYRFLVQAKKLFFSGDDNYPLISYSNKNGTQIDLLLDAARMRNALPLYMYYSIGESNITEQINNISYIPESVLRWCEFCDNGCYLSLAYEVYDLLYNVPRKRILDSQLLNNSFKLSILDLLDGMSGNDIDRILDDFNNTLVNEKIINSSLYINNKIRGMKHDDRSIPKYLKVFIQNRHDDLSWFENEMNITDISGLSVIDLRNRE